MNEDRNLRREAIRMAVASVTPRSKEDIVKRAESFHIFLKGKPQ